MNPLRHLTRADLFSVVLRAALSLGPLAMAACDAQIDTGKEFEEGPALNTEQQAGLVALQQRAGGPVALELDAAGGVRTLDMTPGANLVGLVGSPEDIAHSFLQQNRGLFRLSAVEADEFEASRVDVDPVTGLRHVTLQRTVEGIPVFQGVVTVHMDAQGGIFRATGADGYRAQRPSNQLILAPEEAAASVAESLGLPSLSPVLVEQDGLKSVFSDPNLLDLIIEPRVFRLSEGDQRFAHQVLISYKDAQNQLQYDIVLVDAQSGEILFRHSIVDTFRGQAFPVAPTGTTDTRVIVDMTGDAVASPSGWVGAARKTVGNNVFAATDLNANNSFGTNEVQPTADANGDFFFPWAAASETVREAAVVNAFIQNNIFHDHLYGLGFTETSGNFQTSNFNRGGAQNDEVQVDVQDGSGTDNANFATPPDGSKPRMQMFLFTITGGAREDSDFDAGIIFHEYSHGVSNRLVGGGSTACLFGTQSGGMGEGWGDYLGGSKLNDPVVGAYVTGNTVRGIRRAPMNNSPFTYADIKSGAMAEVHDAGEIWAATLWSVRDVLGATQTDRLVIAGMKLTPCNPTFLQARDAIIQADANINAGANKCILWQKFAAKGMGFTASSPNHNSTSTIVTSTTLPSECTGGGGGTNPGTGTTTTFTATDVPKAIPDNNTTGASSVIAIPSGQGTLQKVTVDVSVTHTFRGDLVVTLIGPDGRSTVLSNRAGGSADNFSATALDVTSAFTGSPVNGNWTLKVQDLANADVGTINSFKLNVTTSGGTTGNATFTGSNTTSGAIPDNNTTGISSVINATTAGLQVQTVQVKLNITHTFRGDLQVTLTSPAGETRTVVAPTSSDSADNITGTFDVAGFTAGSNAFGNWTLKVVDKASVDIGSLNSWSLGVNTTAP